MRLRGILSTKEKQIIKSIHNTKPVVLFLTNYVTATDCANITLTFGGCPIMADEECEIEEMTKIADVLVLNIGTINSRTLKSMLVAGHTANIKHIPVIFDPCGVGTTQFRKKAVVELLKTIEMSVIKGNAGEIACICELCNIENTNSIDINSDLSSKGVDNSLKEINTLFLEKVQRLAKHLHCVICITGQTDYIISQDQIVLLNYGNKIMSKITGTGCMLNGVIACCCAVNDNYSYSTTLACKIFGQKYYKLLKQHISVSQTFNYL